MRWGETSFRKAKLQKFKFIAKSSPFDYLDLSDYVEFSIQKIRGVYH